MKLNKNAAVYVPEGKDADAVMADTTVLGVSAHQDDLEIMAYSGIADCYGKRDEWFTGVVVTDGAGSPRSGIYAGYTNDEMMTVREKEQNAAAAVGGYRAQFQLKYPSSAVKDSGNFGVSADLAEIILAARPKVVLTHNPADKHDTHVCVFLRVLSALRTIKDTYRPQKLFGMEVWRSLDWSGDKILFDTSGHPNLAAALLGVYDSQISGGKRYDLAALGRRSANATFYESHGVDEVTSGAYGLDMTELIDGGSVAAFIGGMIQDFQKDVTEKLIKYGGGL